MSAEEEQLSKRVIWVYPIPFIYPFHLSFHLSPKSKIQKRQANANAF
jgi:hypothetical protein